MLRQLVLFVLVGALAACTTSPKIFTDYDPGAAGRSYRSYGFFANLGTDDSGYSSLVSQHLKKAISEQLEARGYQFSERPDLAVNFYLHSQSKVRVSQTPSPSYGYYGYRGRYYTGWHGQAYDTHVSEYTEGTLSIDVVDAQTQRLIWQGTAVGTVTEAKRREPQPHIQQAVELMFAEFPLYASD